MKYKVEYQFKWVLIVAFLLLIYLSNLVLIELPFIRMNFTQYIIPGFSFVWQIYSIQTVLVWASGILFGPVLGAAMLGSYLLLGFIGLPIFAGGGGLDYYKEPTFGYLISLPVNAFLSGFLYERNKKVLAAFLPMFTTHMLGIMYLVIFKQSMIDISWHLSFSMIGYDLIFALVLLPVMPFLSFVLKEMVIQEVPTLDSSLVSRERSHLTGYKV